LASESSLTAVVGFLSSVKEKRALRARLAIGDLLPGLENAKRVSEIEDRVRTELGSAEEALSILGGGVVEPATRHPTPGEDYLMRIDGIIGRQGWAPVK
jgi:hypothetical protein